MPKAIAANGGVASCALNSIILLSSTEEAAFLTRILRRYNAGLAIRSARSLKELRNIPVAALARSRLIAFTTSIIVPGDLLDRIGFGAYNFHPGPPTYPGLAPAHFACYDGTTQYGVTAHVMIERVDAGPIVAFDPFQISRGTSVKAVEALAYTRLLTLFRRLAKDLATRIDLIPALPVNWQGRKGTHRRLASLCEMPWDVTRKEFEHRIAVLGAGDYGRKLCIKVHGYRFELAGRDEKTTASAEPCVTLEEFGHRIAVLGAGDYRHKLCVNVHGYRFKLVGRDEDMVVSAEPRSAAPSGRIKRAPCTRLRRSPTCAMPTTAPAP